MLDDLQERIEKLQAFDNAQVLRDAVDGNLETILDLQRQQMIDGKDVNGDDVLLDGFGYAESTILFKKLHGEGIGAITDHVTRYQTGALNESLEAQLTGDEVLFESPLPYWPSLLARTGDVGVGLDPDNRRQFAETVALPTFIIALEEKTGLTL